MANLLGRDEAARYLGLGRTTLWELTRQRLIPAVRIGRRVLYFEADLAAFAAAHSDAATPERTSSDGGAR